MPVPDEPRDAIGLRWALREAAEKFFDRSYSMEWSKDGSVGFKIKNGDVKYTVTIAEEPEQVFSSGYDDSAKTQGSHDRT